LREVLIPSPKNPSKDRPFSHPAKVDYQNPICAIFWAAHIRFNFETKDGAVGAYNKGADGFDRKLIGVENSEVSKIQVVHDDRFIFGFRFFDRQNAVIYDKVFLELKTTDVVLN